MTCCLNLIRFGDEDIVRNLNLLAYCLLYQTRGNPQLGRDPAENSSRIREEENNPYHLIIGD